jgi:Ca2+-transporting ATPase
MSIEIGKIARLVGETKREETPLQKKLSSLGKTLGYAVIAIAVVVFLLGFILKKATLVEMLLMSISLAVAAIPEGLPAIVTICLAMGIQQMAKQNALIRRLPSVETLGSVTVICTDKTGTLTKNEMTVKKIFANNSVIDVSGEGYSVEGRFTSNGKIVGTRDMEMLLKAGALCNDSKLKPQIIGDPTEIALAVCAEKAGLKINELHSRFKRINELPFDSSRKMMSTLNSNGGEYFVFTKGAVENVLKNCSRISENGKARKISGKDRIKILDANKKFAESALRVLAFAYKPQKKGKIAENDLIFLGLQAMIDPPREDAREAMQKCRDAGIRVIMITGDHELTAHAVGKSFGLSGKVVNGEELEKISVEDLRKIIEETSIFARVNPEHKLKIVNALQANGHFVAMTGDGVNDAPALKKANIGIAMGITGTDVAKEASDMILVDDNFASIVNAVEKGRGIFDNIKKFVEYLVSSNLGEVLTILGGIILGAIMNFPLPLLALQILWINLVTDGLPALALSVEPCERDIMSHKPERGDVIARKSFLTIFLTGIIMAIGTLAVLQRFLPDEKYARTAAFSCLMIFQMFNVLNCKSEKHSVFSRMFSNWYLIGAIIVSVLLQVIVTYPPLSGIFGTTALKFYDWILVLAVSSSVLIFREIQKVVQR